MKRERYYRDENQDEHQDDNRKEDHMRRRKKYPKHSFTYTLLKEGKCKDSMRPKGICIPSLPLDVTKQQLYTRFRCLNIGTIRNIVIVKKEVIGTAFITIDRWNESQTSKTILERFEREQPVYICYSFPHYLKCIILKRNK